MIEVWIICAVNLNFIVNQLQKIGPLKNLQYAVIVAIALLSVSVMGFIVYYIVMCTDFLYAHALDYRSYVHMQ